MFNMKLQAIDSSRTNGKKTDTSNNNNNPSKVIETTHNNSPFIFNESSKELSPVREGLHTLYEKFFEPHSL